MISFKVFYYCQIIIIVNEIVIEKIIIKDGFYGVLIWFVMRFAHDDRN